MGDSCTAGSDSGTTDSETRIYPYCLYWLFRTYSLWRDTLLSLDLMGRTLFLPQTNVLGFVDSPWEALSSLRSGWIVGVRKVEGRGEGQEWELRLVCKMRKDSF